MDQPSSSTNTPASNEGITFSIWETQAWPPTNLLKQDLPFFNLSGAYLSLKNTEDMLKGSLQKLTEVDSVFCGSSMLFKLVELFHKHYKETDLIKSVEYLDIHEGYVWG